MVDEKKILGTLGLAMKAGKVESGEFLTEKSIQDLRARLVIVAGDASKNTKKKFKNSCDYYKVPYFEYASKEIIGKAIGKQFRASIAISDAGFAKAIIKKLNAEER